MDTLSSSVSTLKIPAIPSSSRLLHHSKTHAIPLLNPASKSNSNSNSNSTKSITQLSSLNSPLNPSQFSSYNSTHRNPASGYAAALADMLQSNDCSLDSAVKDARRLSRLIQEEGVLSALSNPKDKGRAIKRLGKIGNYNRFVVRLMKMLVEKNKVGIMNQVMVELQRICDELSGTKVVLVSSNNKLDEFQVFEIAHTVHKLTGAMQVKVRSLVRDNSASFAT